MAANTDPIFVGTPRVFAAEFTISDTNVSKAISTIGAEGSRIDQLLCLTDDTTAVDLDFWINDGATDFYLGTAHLAIGAGHSVSVPAVDAIPLLMLTGKFLVVPNGYVLKAACRATMTTAKKTEVIGIGGDY